MRSLSYDCGKITSIMKVRFTVMVEEEKDLALNGKKNLSRIIDRKEYKGVDYFKVAPHPFITIDISAGRDKSDDKWNPNTRINLNRMYKLVLCSRLKKLIMAYSENKNLFYCDMDGRLHAKKDETIKYVQEVATQNGIIRLAPVVVYKDPENPNSGVEGAFFMINTPDNYCTLTFDELVLLYDTLFNLNMDQMAMNLLVLEKAFQDENKEVIQQSPEIEAKENEPQSNNTPAQCPNTIPDFN